MLKRTFLTKQEKNAPGLKISKDRVTSLLCANDSGSLKCKPMLVYRSETPRALKGKRKESLLAFWKSNNSAWVTQINFKDWFTHSFVLEVREFILKENMAFKILLLLDNATGHPETLYNMNPKVEVAFLPANTTSLIQPMDNESYGRFY